jgi:hypothetical protein
MPEHDFICEHCGYRTTQFALAVSHVCKTNGNQDTLLIRLDDPTTLAVDIFCDGCQRERLGEDHHAYSNKVARDSAAKDGWECSTKTGDWCPECVQRRKVSA